MGGRWVNLARSALYDGSLSFEGVTHHDSVTTARESFAIAEAENRLHLDYLRFKASLLPFLAYSEKERAITAEKLLSMYEQVAMPWEAKERKQFDPVDFYTQTMQRHKEQTKAQDEQEKE